MLIYNSFSFCSVSSDTLILIPDFFKLCLLFSFLLVGTAKYSPILLILPRNDVWFYCVWFFIFIFSISLISSLIFICFPLLSLGLIAFLFLVSWKGMLGYWFVTLLIYWYWFLKLCISKNCFSYIPYWHFFMFIYSKNLFPFWVFYPSVI